MPEHEDCQNKSFSENDNSGSEKDKNSASPAHKDFSFAVGGMTCAACVRFVEKALAKVPGVSYVSVNLNDGRAYAVTDEYVIWEDLAGAVKSAGYEPLENVPGEAETEKAFRNAARRVIVSWAVAVPAMVLMILHMSGFKMTWLPYAELAAGAAVLFGPGRRILKGAWIAVSHKHANMDVLVSLGTLAAWCTAALAAAGLPVRSFGSLAPMLPAFHLTGRLVEERLRRRSGSDLRALMEGESGRVRVVDGEGEQLLPSDSVKAGARVRVLGGERIPLDGVVVQGSGAVSEALVTGESLPVTKGLGDELIGGTVLESGLLEMEVTRVGEDAFLARMLALVEQAQGVQVPLQALADRVAGVFVPVVFLLALASLGVWAVFYPVPRDAGVWTTAVYAFVSMLVVACPCALGLAAPVAVSVGSGLAARRGLLIKGGEALQRAGEPDVILLDKTGTLTLGQPVVIKSDLNDSLCRTAGALEGFSVHPLAKAVREWAEKKDGDFPLFTDVEETAGKGISGRIGNDVYELGRPSVLPEWPETDEACIFVELRCNGVVKGHIALADPLRPEAAASVKALKERGLRPVMVSGDGVKTARAVAAAVGIAPEDVRAGLSPEDKLRIVQEFQAQGKRTAMTGDGINDAAALKASDVGFAFAQGTDLSMEAGDVVIIHGGLEKIGEAMDISSLIVRKIKGNLIWAFAYNVIALPVAAMALIHPIMAEAAMTFSSIAVVLNALSIRKTAERNWKGSNKMSRYEFDVQSMSCGHCTARVEKALEPLCSFVDVSLEDAKAVVETEKSPDDILGVLEEAGYPGTLNN